MSKSNLKNHIGNVLENGLTDAQEMWFEAILSVITQPKFNLDLGDMNYVLGNMVAKYVSSSKHYKITEEALNHIKSLEIKLDEPLHIKNKIYGKKNNTILEHIIPVNIIKHALVENKKNIVQIKNILNNSGFVVIATRSQDRLLKDAKLSKKMPDNWNGFGDKPEKRYDAVNIKISKILIEHCGQICR
jgi:hypothetical protein